MQKAGLIRYSLQHAPVMRISYRKGVVVPTQRCRGLRVLHVLLAATSLRMRAFCTADFRRARV